MNNKQLLEALEAIIAAIDESGSVLVPSIVESVKVLGPENPDFAARLIGAADGLALSFKLLNALATQVAEQGEELTDESFVETATIH